MIVLGLSGGTGGHLFFKRHLSQPGSPSRWQKQNPSVQ
jgi:hypothetical protein